MDEYTNRTPIRNWAEDDRPREKFLMKGRLSLSDAELLAILLVSGTRSESAVDLAKTVLMHARFNLAELSKMSISNLVAIRGIGQARAIAILAALELGRRRNESDVLTREKISRSRDAYEIFRSTMGDRPYEEFWIILLNRANKVIKKVRISEGGVSGTVVDPKKVFKFSLDLHACSIILGHNHPSGLITPSEADIKITKKLVDAGKLMEIAVLDHLIIGQDQFYSFADEGSL